MYKLFILFLLNGLIPFTAMAEVVKCTATETSKVKSFWFSRVTHEYKPQWLEGEVNLGLFNGKKRLLTKMAPRQNAINYVGYYNDEDFFLSLGEYRGEGHYKNALLTYKYQIRYADPKTVKTKVDCVIEGHIPFKNYCEETEENNPQANLIAGARNQDIDLVLASLPCDVDVDIPDLKGCTPLLLAIDADCGTGVFDVYNNGAYSFKITKALLNEGANVSAMDPVTKETSLHKSVMHQELRASRLLLENDADVNAKDVNGVTPLMRAVEIPVARDFIDLLLEYGADVNIKNNKNQTAVDIAKQLGYDYLIPFLNGSVKLSVTGDENGKCSPSMLHAESGKKIMISLENKSNQMLMFEIKSLNFSIMAMANQTISKMIDPSPSVGNYHYECGPHGGPMTQGSLMVME